jgi:hypothetical protein
MPRRPPGERLLPRDPRLGRHPGRILNPAADGVDGIEPSLGSRRSYG